MNSNDLKNNVRGRNKYKLVFALSGVLVLIVAFLSFCSSQFDGRTEEEQIEAEAKKRVALMNRRQQEYFSKHQTFFKADDSPGVVGSGLRFNTSTCYGYYTVITETAVFSYGRQDGCRDRLSGFVLHQYIGGVFVVRDAKNARLETLAILCYKKGTDFYYRSLSKQPFYPFYKDGAVFCAPGTRRR